MNQVELSEILGRDPSTLWEWQDQGLPIKRVGAGRVGHEYDTSEVIAWLIARALERAGSTKAALELEALELDVREKRRRDAERAGALVPADQVAPVWENRVLTAAAYMIGRASRLAGVLEAAAGIEAKRALLKKEDAQFLTHLGVYGEAMQEALEAFFARCATADVGQLFAQLQRGEGGS